MNRSEPFFVSDAYASHQKLLNELCIDYSYSYHEDGKMLYIIEIVDDAYVEVVKSSWNSIVTAEKWATRFIYSYDQQLDAFRA